MKREDYCLKDLAAFAKADHANVLPTASEKYSTFNSADSFYENAASYFFITDYSRMNYYYVSKSVKNVLGDTQNFFLQKGLEYMFSCIPIEDRKRLKQIHEKMFRYFYATPINERKELKFTINYRFKRNDQKNIMILQETVINEISLAGNPIADFCSCTDITRYLDDNALQLIIYKKKEDTYHPVFEYKVQEHLDILTNRQIEILNLLSKGFTTSVIAEKLFLSEETVKIHRKNILQRTGAKNSIQAVNILLRG